MVEAKGLKSMDPNGVCVTGGYVRGPCPTSSTQKALTDHKMRARTVRSINVPNLVVHITQCILLRLGLSDPYVELYVNGKKVGRSKVIKKTLNPVWNRFLRVEADDFTHVSFSVKDWDMYVACCSLLMLGSKPGDPIYIQILTNHAPMMVFFRL